MTYSRSRTQHQQKSKRRSKTRMLLLVNGILIGCIAVAAVLVWQSRNGSGGDGTTTGQPHAQSIGSPGSDASEPLDPEPASEAEPEASPSYDEASAAPETDGDSVSLALVGDILPAAKVLDLMKINGYDYPFLKARPVLEAADIAAGNLETPITARGTPAEDKQYVFRGAAEAVPALKEAGFDFLSLANNHTLDYGWEGLSDTMDALDDADLQHAGSGNDDREAFSPAYIESNGITVGFVSVTRVVPDVSWKADRSHPGVAEAYSPDRAVAAIKEAKENADIVVVMVHWGVERADRPVAHQTDLAHRFVDAGADIVVGSHPHVLQGFEFYKDKWIAYSLGNFVFSTTSSLKTSETGVLSAECGKDGSCALKFQPMFATNSQPAPMEETAGKALLAQLSELSYGASVEEDGTIVARN
ncbi:CapA family protein [Cohnella lupini]|uniref:Poly-gamma-glutamate synthesis protein (Capsule biosynthesis protein) n=1 Tax=Cohnella lupini TaxID=1294267 RepID=A0A3D9IUW5_9BACL|nr:CapA family protein [Cohnella lupini]RED65593.1 poly-gamma-glutamate synthesis protein (capsule biosynthesis protein) [Cohnella lupini]